MAQCVSGILELERESARPRLRIPEQCGGLPSPRMEVAWYRADTTVELSVGPADGNAIGRSPALHSSKVNFVGFLADGRRAVSVDENGLRLVIWDSRAGSAIGQPLEIGSSPSANTPRVFMFGDRVVTIDDERRVVIWELATNAWLARVSTLVKEPGPTVNQSKTEIRDLYDKFYRGFGDRESKVLPNGRRGRRSCLK